MPTLRERQRTRAGASARTAPAEASHRDFILDTAYNPPHLGILRATGRTMSLVERGNTKGMSATWRGVDEYGGSSIVSLGDVIETGMLCGPIPPPAEQLEQIFSNLKFRDEGAT